MRSIRMGLSLGVLVAVLAVSCSERTGRDSGFDTTQQTNAGGTLLFDVVDRSWTFDELPPGIDELPADIRDLVILVPTKPPQGEAVGSVHLLAERAVPADNYYGTVRVDWEDSKGNLSSAFLRMTAAANSPPTCQQRLQSGDWEETSVRGGEACRAVADPERVIFEWESDSSYFHFESSALSEDDAVQWLDTWVLLR